MSELEQACTDLAAWRPAAAELITEPDRGGTRPSRSKPGSRPPWNSQVAAALYDIHAGARATEQQLRYAVSGTVIVRGGTDANTEKALHAIQSLATAVDDVLAGEVTRTLTRLLTAVLRLPAIDLEQRPRILPCPRCQRRMLRYWENSDQVACYGCVQRATISIGYVSGEPILTWADGYTGPAPEGTP